MSRKQSDNKQVSDDDTSKGLAGASGKASPSANSGYAEKHGPRFDPDGWGEANAARSDRAGTSEDGSQGHAAGERSFDHGPDDTAAEEAASDAALREPGDRGATDAQPTGPAAADEESPDENKPGTPGPDSP